MNRLSAITGAVLILILALTGWGCGQNQSVKVKPVTKVRLCETVHSIFYAPMYAAINQGLFRQEGIEIELSTAQGTDKAMTAILSNAADISLAGPEPTVYVYNEGRDDYAINFAACTKRDGSFLVGRKPEPNFHWENLKGKTVIGGRPGGMPEMLLEYILNKHGLVPGKDVKLITNLQFTATAGAFKGGLGDYVALFEPTGSLLEEEGAGYVVASLGIASGEVPYTGFMAKKSYIESHQELIQRFTNAVYRGQLWVRDHSPFEIATAIQSFFPDTDRALLTKVVERYKNQDTWKATPVLDFKDFTHMEEILVQSKMIKAPVSPELLVTHRFAEEAVKEIK